MVCFKYVIVNNFYKAIVAKTITMPTKQPAYYGHPAVLGKLANKSSSQHKMTDGVPLH
jgi:hypothetical protein